MIKPETMERLEAIKAEIAENMDPFEPDEIRAAIWSGITQKHSGKMAGLTSFSTCTAINPLCRKMAGNPALICSHCYAETLLNMRPALAEKAARNTALVTTFLLPPEALPVLPWRWFRLEAFGDLMPGAAGVVQARNYLRWAARNPETVFAWWTKHPGTVRKALQAEGLEALPVNVNLIYSIPETDPAPEAVKAPDLPGLFATFQVETAPGWRQNCPKSCRDCLRCYTRRDPNAAPVQIVEKLK